MAGGTSTLRARKQSPSEQVTTLAEPLWAQWLIIGVALAFLLIFLGVPLVAVFYSALENGWRTYLAAFEDSESMNAIKLTLIVAAIAVPLNTIFGVAAAWAVSKFKFPGRQLLVTFIDLPFAVSPVISGLIYVLIFSSHGWLSPEILSQGTAWAAPYFQSWAPGFATWLETPKVIFAVPGIILATVFVTFPFVARELIPLMQSQGSEEELAAITLGANGWQMFWKVTLPNIKWGLVHGIILCNARAMGEFGAVSVISGHIPNKTNTLPLQIEILYNGFATTSAAFALASVLTMLALATLIIKAVIESFYSKSTADS